MNALPEPLPVPDTVDDLVNQAIFLSTETQAHFETLVGDIADNWETDFSGTPSLTFGQGEQALHLSPHLLGSADGNHGTWHWGWSPNNDWTGPAVELAHALRKHAVVAGPHEFTVEELDSNDDFALRLTLAAKRVSGHWAHFPLQVGTTTVWLLADAPELTLGEPDIVSVVKTLASGLTLTAVADHRAALKAYARLRGFGLVPLDHAGEDSKQWRILTADGYADTEFDELLRLTKCQLKHPLAGQAAQQFAELGTLAPAPIDFAVPAESYTPTQVAKAAPVPAARAADALANPEAVIPDTSGIEAEKATPAEVANTSASTPTDSPAATPATATHGDPEREDSAREAVPEEPTEQPEVQHKGTAQKKDTVARDTVETEPQPAATSEPRPNTEHEPAKEPDLNKEPEKKKGFFRKLFGR